MFPFHLPDAVLTGGVQSGFIRSRNELMWMDEFPVCSYTTRICFS